MFTLQSAQNWPICSVCKNQTAPSQEDIIITGASAKTMHFWMDLRKFTFSQLKEVNILKSMDGWMDRKCRIKIFTKFWKNRTSISWKEALLQSAVWGHTATHLTRVRYTSVTNRFLSSSCKLWKQHGEIKSKLWPNSLIKTLHVKTHWMS